MSTQVLTANANRDDERILVTTRIARDGLSHGYLAAYYVGNVFLALTAMGRDGSLVANCEALP